MIKIILNIILNIFTLCTPLILDYYAKKKKEREEKEKMKKEGKTLEENVNNLSNQASHGSDNINFKDLK